MVGFEGTSLSPFLHRAVAETGVGGVIFLKRNIESEGQLSALCDDILGLSRHAPPLLALDQEGGEVCRVGEGLAVLPGNMALGAARSSDLARRAGSMTALQIRGLGLNLVFAPVLDVLSTPENSVIGTRSYGDDPVLVAELGRACIEGLRDGGALSTAKHFPGLGRARFDPHHEVTPIDVPLEELMRDDIFPFRDARADFIMSSHASYTCLGAEKATLSGRSLSELLRQKLKYDGAVVSDDLCMKAISGTTAVGPAAVGFLKAGGDMILICDGEECLDDVIGEVEEALGRGDITNLGMLEKRRRLDAARGRVRDRRGDYSCRDLEDLSLEIGRASVTVCRDGAGLLPLSPESGDRILVIGTRYPKRKEGSSLFPDLFRGRHGRSESVLVEPAPSEQEIRRVAGKSAGARLTIFLTYDCHRHVEQLKLIEAVAEVCGNIICISTGTPCDIAELEIASAVLATYGYSDASMTAAVEVLFGDRVAKGILPVKIN